MTLPVPAIASVLRKRLGAIGNTYAREDPSTGDQVAALARRPIDRRVLGRSIDLGGLGRLGASVDERLRDVTPSGPRVLVLSLRGWPDHLAYEGVIAQALRLRGADVRMLTCGGGLPICEMGWQRVASPRPCDRCAWLTGRALTASRIPSERLGDFLPWGNDGRDAPTDAAAIAHNGPDPVKQAAISVPWFLHTTDLTNAPKALAVAADYAVVVAGVQAATARLLDRHDPEIVFAVNGLFAVERAVRAIALARGLRFPTYEISPRSGALAFAQHVPAPDYDTDAAWERFRDTPLTDRQHQAITELLENRARGVGGHERYFEASSDGGALQRTLEIPPDHRIISLFTNLSWDSATLGKEVGFRSMLDWIEHATRVAASVRDTTLVIRVHPAEVSWSSREFVAASLLKRIGTLPANVRIVHPEQPLSSYALVDASALVLAYATTVGLEAAVDAKPVAVAAQTHYRGRGFTYDVDSPIELEQLMHEPPRTLSPRRQDLALRYAYTWFFRCAVPFPIVGVHRGRVQTLPRSAEEIEHGVDPYLDFVCDRLLDGHDFVVPEELAARPIALLSRG